MKQDNSCDQGQSNPASVCQYEAVILEEIIELEIPTEALSHVLEWLCPDCCQSCHQTRKTANKATPRQPL